MDLDPTLLSRAFVTLLVIMDPLGNVPVFLALTALEGRDRRRRLALHAVAVATVVIYLFAFFGTAILDYLGISLESLLGAGGVVLFLVALQMLQGEVSMPTRAEGVNVALVPLGTPLVAGPGAIAAVMVYMSQANGVGGQISVALAIAAALGVVYVALAFSSVLERVLKDNGIHLVTRVMGMLLTAISIEMVARAVFGYVQSPPVG